MPAQATAARTENRLGRLKSLGIAEPWQACLYLPTGWDDFTRVVRSLDDVALDDRPACFEGVLKQEVSFRFDGKPRAVVRLSLSDTEWVGFTLFGDVRHLDLRPGRRLVVHGEPSWFGGQCWLKSARIVEPEWKGRICPKYAGKPRVINPETVRERILKLLPLSVREAEKILADQIAVPAYKPLAAILRDAHVPDSVEEGLRAHEWLDRASAAHVAARLAHAIETRRGAPRFRLPERDPALLKGLALAFPFKLTDEQKKVVVEILSDMRTGTMRRLLSGDVGTGKTAVYGLALAYAIELGARAFVLLPNQTLARQIHVEFASWWPHLEPLLVTGDTDDVPPDARLVIGTTAILHRNLGQPDIMVVDEQHKFSREQRERLVTPGTHLLEVSATSIPRTQALARYGALAVSRLTACHVKKDIETAIITHGDRAILFSALRKDVAEGDKLLVIYPRRGDDESDSELPSAAEAFEAWQRAFGDMVRLVHGGQTPEENQAAIQDMVDGRARVLVSTTVVEVGVTIPGLRHCVVVHAERFGLTTLHQIRGRLCRDGGRGTFTLYLPSPVRPEVMERLNVLVRTTDGFVVAEHDMRLRGFGDLSSDSDRQTGDGMGFLIGRPINVDALDAAIRNCVWMGATVPRLASSLEQIQSKETV